MTPDTAALRALADAATPGPWSVSTLSPHIIYSETDCRPVAVVVNGETPWFNEADAELIAALHPDTVRALCDAADEVERLRGDVEALTGLLSAGAIGAAPGSDSHRMVLAMRDHYKRQRDASRTAHAALVAELRALCDDSDHGWVHRRDLLALLDRHAPTTGATP